MKIVTSAQMSRIDKESSETFGIPSSILMENAGIRLWDKMKKTPGSIPEILTFVCGKGNNGGDGLVMARQALSEGFAVQVLASDKDGSPLFRANRDILLKLGVTITNFDESPESFSEKVGESSCIVDALLGTGIKGRPKYPYSNIIKMINDNSCPVFSIDVPSGLSGESGSDILAVDADYTLTVGLPKLCLYLPEQRKYCGVIHVVPICFPGKLVRDPSLPGTLLSGGDIPAYIAKTKPWDYKYSRGVVAVAAGSSGMEGAAVMCAKAAAHTQAGMVYAVVPPLIVESVKHHLVEIQTRELNKKNMLPEGLYGKSTCFLAGPGWGRDCDRSTILVQCLAAAKPLVIDADGLYFLKKVPPRVLSSDSRGPLVLTPHPGEAAMLTGKSKSEILGEPVGTVLAIAATYGAICVLKSHILYVGSPEGMYWIVDGMDPVLGTAGSGDVLAGIIAGLLSRHGDPLQAVISGILLLLETGKACYHKKGWVTATGLIDELPVKLAEYD